MLMLVQTLQGLTKQRRNVYIANDSHRKIVVSHGGNSGDLQRANAEYSGPQDSALAVERNALSRERSINSQERQIDHIKATRSQNLSKMLR